MTVVLRALGDSRELVQPALRAAVARLDPSTRLVVGYHLGWCDQQGSPVTANGGKAVRPALALLAARAAGGPDAATAALPAAVAVELVHNFSLVHDDLMDRDAERRHRRTVWAVWGDATAVLAGDAMLSLAHEVLLDAGTRAAAQAAGLLAVATRELIRGQAQDVAFESRGDVGLAECLDMAAGKTGALLSASAAMGAVFGGAGAAQVDALAAYGSHVGLAFQLVDDLLGIWGSPDVTGKPVYSDLRSRKKTLPISWCVEHGGAAGLELARWLADERRPSTSELARAADLVERCGGRDWAAAEARRRIRLAEEALAPVSLAGRSRAELLELAAFVVDREA